MKTSNKLLLVLTLALFLSMASVMLYAKSQMISKEEYRKELKLTGKIVDRVLQKNLTINDIEMGDNFNWIIDPNTTEVIVSGDEALISKLEVSDGDQFRVKTGGVDHYYNDDHDMVTITVGTKNLNEMIIEGQGNARITAVSSFSLEDLNLELHGNSKCELEINSPQMKVSSHGNAKMTLIGQTENIDASVSGNGKMYFEKLDVETVSIRASGNGKFYGGVVKSISGNGSGNARIEIKDANQKSNVSTSGNARFTINR